MTDETTKKHDSQVLSERALQVQRGGARAAVLGVNDGLVSTLCIVLGVAGAGSSGHTVLLAGLAGLVAGALSMAVGEWISVTSQVELFRGVLKDIRQMLHSDREILIEQLEKYFEKRVTHQTAAAMAADLAQNDRHLFKSYVHNVIGINPDELGSPWTAALSSFFLFTAGSITALVPWFFVDGKTAILLSIAFTAVGGLITGSYVGKSGGNSVLKSSVRQLLIIIAASVITYGIGKLFGVSGL